MAKHYESLSDKHQEVIKKQQMIFVVTEGQEGYVNRSPKGMDSFRILDGTRVCWLNLTGSGNETAAHVLENGRMTVMFCSFDKQPLILRLYGQAATLHPRDSGWDEFAPLFPDYLGARQIFVLELALVQTSCGFVVPYYEFSGERPALIHWAEKRGEEGLERYWVEENALSLDGKDTGVLGRAK